MRQLSYLFLLLPAILTLPFQGKGQGSITSGSFTFSYNNFNAPASTNFSLGAVDQTFATWWWYRVSGDTQETPFPAPNTESYVGNVATFTWSDVNSRGLLSAQLVTTLTPVNANQATVSFTFTVNEIAGNPLNVNLFLYIDVDKGASIGGDLATLFAPNTIRITDQVLLDFCDFSGPGSSAYAAGVFGSELGLTDAAVTSFANTGLPFGPGDGTYGFQWIYNIAANGSQQTLASLFSSWAPQPAGPGTITDGNAIFVWNDVTPPSWSANFNGVGTGDQVFAMAWYYRVAGDGQETPFPTPNRTSYIGNVATFEWDDVSGRGLFAARLVTTLTEGIPPSGTVISDFYFRNLGGQSLSISVFEYLDVDKGGSAGGDLATLESPLTIRIEDDVMPDYCYFKAVGAANFQVTSFNALGNSLNDGGITNLNGGGLPFGPGDGVYGFQWNMSLSPGGSNSLRSGLAANEPINLSISIPTMGEWALILLSLLLLSLGASFILRQQPVLAGAGNGAAVFNFTNLPFSRSAYLKTLLGSILLAAVLGVLTYTLSGSLSLTDIGGAMLCLPVLAYLLHLTLPANQK